MSAPITREWVNRPSIDAIIAAIQDDDGSGFCFACGEQAWGVEPDARGYDCETCGEAKVYGAEECLLMIA